VPSDETVSYRKLRKNKLGTTARIRRLKTRKEIIMDNTQKDPKDWVSGDDPVTGAQESYLKTLSEQAHKPVPHPANKAEASKLIDEMKDKAGLD
jgi:hypothetical protein